MRSGRNFCSILSRRRPRSNEISGIVKSPNGFAVAKASRSLPMQVSASQPSAMQAPMIAPTLVPPTQSGRMSASHMAL